MNILDKIVADKRIEVEQTLSSMKKRDITKQTKDSRVPKNFRQALNKDQLTVIAEVKKASPSKGIIREDFNPMEIARQYAQNGADCISVLTESKYFQGNKLFLKEIREHVNIPLLRKDFIIDERQIRESYDLGADAVLLIVSILTKQELSYFQELAKSFGLSCLVEVHSKDELDIALKCNCDLIGINNRNLKTFETNIHHSIELKSHIPDHVVCVSESGIRSYTDCESLFKNGFDAVLVGETLMRNENPGLAIPQLLGR